jgi:hypothetical protein
MITGKAAFGHTQSEHREISSFGSPPALSFRARASVLEEEDFDMRHEGPRGQEDGQGPPTSVVNDPEKYVTFGVKNHVRFKSHRIVAIVLPLWSSMMKPV